MSREKNMEIQCALGLVADGILGPRFDRAIRLAIAAGRVQIAPAQQVIIKLPDEGDDLPEAGRAKLQGVNPALQSIVLATSARCPVPFTCIEGLRSAARQAELVAKGASKTQNSRHLTGHAVDLWPLDPTTGKLLPSDAAFQKGSREAKDASDRLWRDLRTIAEIMKAVAAERGIALEWGGDWGWDAPHFQLPRDQFPA